MDRWLSTEEAAAYLCIGRSKMYRLAQKGRVPHTRVGKQYRFRQTDLDDWKGANMPIDRFFCDTPADIVGNHRLREPQLEAWTAVRDWFMGADSHALVQMPVGTGKTGLMALLPFGIARGRVLVIAPNVTIRTELAAALDVTNQQKCFWRKTGVLRAAAMSAGPYCTVLDGPDCNLHDCDAAHIVVTNIQQLVSSADRWLPALADDYFDLILIDEGHHNVAPTWRRVLDKFAAAKVVSLTATPFRSDSRQVAGQLVYRYSFSRAMMRGYIKRLQGVYVAPDTVEVSFVYRGDTSTHTLEEVLELKEEEWFSRGVALSEECNRHIVDASINRLEQLRQSGCQHQVIAVACSVDHARAVRSLYAERGYEAAELHSNMPQDEQESVIRKLRAGLLDCIVQVAMLGEGFDHPNLSVAAVFRPFRTLSPYIQFVGRIMRVIVQNDPVHRDNQGFVVSHVGMNTDALFEDFRSLDSEDRKLFDHMLGGLPDQSSESVLDEMRRTRLLPEMVVNREIVSQLFERDFIDPPDELLLAELQKQFELLGLDIDQADLEQLIRQTAARDFQGTRSVESPGALPVQPQRRRAEARRRLNEQAKVTGQVLLNRFDLSGGGFDIGRGFPGQAGKPNLPVAITLVQKAVNSHIDAAAGCRRDLSFEQLESATSQLPDILESLTRQLIEVLDREPVRQVRLLDTKEVS